MTDETTIQWEGMTGTGQDRQDGQAGDSKQDKPGSQEIA